MPSIIQSMENLPADITIDILSRLPVKTIIHCKCVCKKWLNLLISSYFINLHHSRSPAGLMVHKSGYLKWVEIEDKLDHHHFHHDPIMNFDLDGFLPFTQMIPVGSVDGLICIWRRGVIVDKLYICNPVTREYFMLPRQESYKDGHGIIVYSFGVSSLTGEYKVLRTFQGNVRPFHLSSRSDSNVLEAEVYTLGTGQWRSLGQVPCQFGGFGGPFLNGHFHWNLYDQDAPEKIFTFDLDEETFQLFPSPPAESEAIQGSRIRYHNLAVLKGCLCKSYGCGDQFSIWVMKKYGIKESWHKELVITGSISADPNWLIRVIVVKGLKDGSILMVHGERLSAYCPKSRTIEDLEIIGSWSIVLAHHPSFFKLQNFESERVHSF